MSNKLILRSVKKKKPLLNLTPDKITDSSYALPVFQALGTVKGEIIKDKSGYFFLKNGTLNIRLIFRGYKKKFLLENPDRFLNTPYFLRVYPKSYIKGRGKVEIFYEVIGWDKENTWEEAENIFRLKGIWQTIPQVQSGVISVYRNDDHNSTETRLKPTHLPVQMKRSDINIYRFNRNQSMEKWFVLGLFEFDASSNQFIWRKDIVSPSKDIPSYLNPRKL